VRGALPSDRLRRAHRLRMGRAAHTGKRRAAPPAALNALSCAQVFSVAGDVVRAVYLIVSDHTLRGSSRAVIAAAVSGARRLRAMA
jgi:hypothetical protein